MAKIAVIKPDHLGDMILASPAIGAILSHYRDVTIFASPWALSLAKTLFPAANVRPLELFHLAKNPSCIPLTPIDLSQTLAEFDMSVFLRADGFLSETQKFMKSPYISCLEDPKRHESEKHYEASAKLVGAYDILDYFPYRRPRGAWPDLMDTIGLCVSAGFATNKLPNTFWVELGRILMNRGRKISVIGGPAETNDVDFISSTLGETCEKLIGGADFNSFWQNLEAVDVVVGSDSGSLHLCSLAAPIMGLYTSSAWWNYAPLGSWNRVYSLNIPCAPCVQFSKSHVNACVTRECSSIDPLVIANKLAPVS